MNSVLYFIIIIIIIVFFGGGRGTKWLKVVYSCSYCGGVRKARCRLSFGKILW